MSGFEAFTFDKEDPSFYGGNELHRVKQEKIRTVMKKYGFDALLLFQSSSVRYVTDFFVKGYRAYGMALEYLTVVPLEGEPILGYLSGSD